MFYRAPYGKGMETVIDEKVRKTWQLNPSNFSINNAKWESCIKELVDNVGQKLGFDGKCVEARLYKFLLYEEGSHFKVNLCSQIDFLLLNCIIESDRKSSSLI